MTRVLDLTSSHAGTEYRNAEVHNAPDGGQYDVVLTSFALSADYAEQSPDHLKNWADCLVVGGELHVIEPSAEWVSREVRAGRTGLVFQMHVYGWSEKQRHSLYGLEQLREMMQQAGLVTQLAITRPYKLAQTETGEEFFADQHYLVAVKFGEKVAKQWTTD